MLDTKEKMEIFKQALEIAKQIRLLTEDGLTAEEKLKLSVILTDFAAKILKDIED